MSSVKDLLHTLGVKPSKTYGQNFLIDPSIVETIIRFGRLQEGEKVVEIGGGLGALTAGLSIASDLTVIEVDGTMASHLQQKFPKACIMREDVRFVEFAGLGSNLTVFGNLPYSFSTDIVFHLIKERLHIKRAVLLLQKEFVERMIAGPGGRTYGALSVGVQLWCELRPGPVISGDSFYPPADVDSMLVELKFRDAPLVELIDEIKFQRIVKLAFRHRRKKLFNSLRSSGLFEADHLRAAFVAAAIDTDTRAEALSIDDFARLAKVLNHGLSPGT